MTHLSDFSYLDRLVANVFFFGVFLYYVFVVHRALSELSKEKLMKNSRLIVILLYVGAYVCVISYDCLATNMKYEEGFVDTCLQRVVDNDTSTVHRYPKEAFENKESGMFSYAGPHQINATFTNQGNCGIRQTPTKMYTDENASTLPLIDMLWNLSCTLRNSGLFLLLAFFNSTVKGWFSKDLIHRREVQIFAVYSVFSLAWYFILPQLFSDPLLSTISPQVLWSVELFLAAFMFLITNRRINGILRSRATTKSSNTTNQMEMVLGYTKALNVALAVTCFGESFGLLALNVDILVVEWRVLYKSKTLTDFYTKIFNFFFIYEPILVMLILYKPPIVQKAFSRSSGVAVSTKYANGPSTTQHAASSAVVPSEAT